MFLVGPLLSAVDKLFKLDNVTHMASVELWVLLTTLLLVTRFLLDFFGPWYADRRMMAVILTMETLNHNLVIYAMGLMQLSGERVNDYFQAWAVLLVTLQYSVKIGRPYTRSKQIPLLDLMSSFWSANLLRVQTFVLLRIPLWLIWSLNAVRIILFFVSSSKAETKNQESMRLVSDYMRYEEALSGEDDQTMASADDDQLREFDMTGYKYLVHGEHPVLKEVQEATQEAATCFNKGTTEESEQLGPSYMIQLRPDQEHKKKLVTIEKIWNDASESGLLGGTADYDNRRKDMCLSFALYKLLRRRFYDLPMHELSRPRGEKKISSLVFSYILGKDSERAFRITEVELSFLQDLFYSKQATMFAGGFMIPVMSLLLSLLLAAATGYIAYPVRYIPERMDQTDRNRITHGVFITRIIVAAIVSKELAEIYLYIFSRWAKVLMLCNYVQHRCLWNPAVEIGMEVMLYFSSKAKWKQSIGQQNFLVSSRLVRPFALNIIQYTRRRITGRIILKDYTKNAIFDALTSLNKDHKKLGKYFENTFGSNLKLAWLSDESDEPKPKVDTHIILVWHIATCLCEIKFFDEVKKLRALQPTGCPTPFVREPRTGTRPKKEPKGRGIPDELQGEQPNSVWCEQYATAVTLSNYCAYLVTCALVPDNGLVARKVLDEVIREIDHVASDVLVPPLSLFLFGSRRKFEARAGGRLSKKQLGTMEHVYECLMAIVGKASEDDDDPDQVRGPDEEAPELGDREEKEPMPISDNNDNDDPLNIRNSITKMGAELGKQLTELYADNAEGLWHDLAKFWTEFLLYLAASTRAAKHRTHLAGNGELITHLWALLSHAGFLGSTSHGEQLLDPEDRQDANPFNE